MEKKQITINVENRVGALADVCEMLGRNGIDISGISAQGEGDRGVIRLITSDPNSTLNILTKQGFNAELEEVAVAEIDDRPGELGKLARKIAKSGLNITCVYSLEKAKGKARLAVVGENLERIRELAKKA